MRSAVTSNHQIHAINPVTLYEGNDKDSCYYCYYVAILIVTNNDALKTVEVNEELYGDNDVGAIYSEADNFVSIAMLLANNYCVVDKLSNNYS